MRLSEDLEELQLKLGVALPLAPLLDRAVTQGSVNQTQAPARETNEKLAFLGDAVIELAIRERIWNRQDASLGTLSIKADEVVRNTILAQCAAAIGVGPHIDLGPGAEAERKTGSVLATALEAAFGSIFLAKGLKEASDCVVRALRRSPEGRNLFPETTDQ